MRSTNAESHGLWLSFVSHTDFSVLVLGVALALSGEGDLCGNIVETYPINVYWGGACLVRPMMRMSQMAASVESRGINLMHSLFFLKATSSKERTTERCESDRDAASSPLWTAEGMGHPCHLEEGLSSTPAFLEAPKDRR